MQRVDNHLLAHCVSTLLEIMKNVEEAHLSTLIETTQSGKEDTLFLDVLPENILT